MPVCDEVGKCSPLYHDQLQTPGYREGDGICFDHCDCGSIPCGEYLFDHRNQSLRDFLVNEYIMGENGLGNPMIDGNFSIILSSFK